MATTTNKGQDKKEVKEVLGLNEKYFTLNERQINIIPQIEALLNGLSITEVVELFSLIRRKITDETKVSVTIG